MTLLRRIHTERRTPNPANITFAGENTCQINMRVQFSYEFVSRSIPDQHPLQEAKKEHRGH
jgi:hypothetical protein